jgi:hypothetical protein
VVVPTPPAPTVAPRITFVYRPGGVQSGNIFTDVFDLKDALASVGGLKILEFDDSLESPIVLPRGTFPMHLVSWTGSAPRAGGVNQARVRVQEGCFLPGLRMISGQIEVECTAEQDAPVADFATGPRLIQLGSRLDDGVPFLYCTGEAPFFDLGEPPGPCVIVVEGHWAEARNPSLVLTPPARIVKGEVVFRLRSFGSVGENMIDAAPETRVILDWYGGIESTNQSRILGRFEIRNPGVRPRNRILPQALAPSAAPVPAEGAIEGPAPNVPQTGDLLLFRPTTDQPILQTLPKIVGSFQSQGRPKSTLGHQVIVKHAGTAGTVHVKPATGDRIDGEEEAVRIRPGESCIFESDGARNWWVVSFSAKPPMTPP